jgi:hypothetical protein
LLAPGTIGLAVLRHVVDKFLQVGAHVLPCAFIMRIRKDPLNRIRKDQDFPELEVLPRPADAGQALRLARIVVFGDQLRAFPHPAEGMASAAHGLSGDGDPRSGRVASGPA